MYGLTRAGLVKRFFNLGWTKGNEDLEQFLDKLPRAGEYFSDDNGCYKSVLGSRVTCEKNEMTNKIEGTNGVLRRKLSRLRRRTKAGSKSYT